MIRGSLCTKLLYGINHEIEHFPIYHEYGRDLKGPFALLEELLNQSFVLWSVLKARPRSGGHPLIQMLKKSKHADPICYSFNPALFVDDLYVPCPFYLLCKRFPLRGTLNQYISPFHHPPSLYLDPVCETGTANLLYNVGMEETNKNLQLD